MKIKIFCTLALCCLSFFRRGKANKKIDNPKKMVIIQNAKLGDMVCTTPMFRAIRSKYPDCQIFVVGDKVNKELLRGNQDITEYLEIEGTFSLAKKLKDKKIDFGCVPGPNFEGLATLFLANIPLIVAPKIEGGWSPHETKSYRLIRKFCVSEPHRMGFYAPGEYLKLLEPINIFSTDTAKHLSFSPQAEIKVRDLFSVNNINDGDLLVGISPGAGNKVKKWPEERFAQVADSIIERYQGKIIIVGSKNDLIDSQKMFSFIKNKKEVISFVGQLSIDELKALISKLKLFVSVDTGPVYIAEAFDTPTIDIVGPMDEKEQPPIGAKHKVVIPPNRTKSELHIMNARVYNREEALRQVEAITFESVMAEVNALIVGI